MNKNFTLKVFYNNENFAYIVKNKKSKDYPSWILRMDSETIHLKERLINKLIIDDYFDWREKYPYLNVEKHEITKV